MNQGFIVFLLGLVYCSPALPESNFINPKGKTVQTRIQVPEGYTRIKSSKDSFGEYLQSFPVKKDGTKVLLYNGKTKTPEDVYVAVLAIDVGEKDLQQCADAITDAINESIKSTGRIKKSKELKRFRNWRYFYSRWLSRSRGNYP